ncbi:hypothetical protein RJ639_034392 [Escallonia herrerae]|uniref:Uncharacterized protein n=1 Tax=Escallonia herrerae TaxID=1293975 RepID=A0AA88WSU9_9ASTE|nr:hypothetical protein RJ639_034392 [Escallonia herrerae]
MSDWAPIFVAVVLFVLLSPGLLFQVPGRNGEIHDAVCHLPEEIHGAVGNQVVHTRCINKWLASHSSCPSSVGDEVLEGRLDPDGRGGIDGKARRSCTTVTPWHVPGQNDNDGVDWFGCWLHYYKIEFEIL